MRIQEVAIAPRFADGVLQGCAVNFQILERDTMYAAGAPVLVDGSFQIYNFGPGRVSAVLKLGLMDASGGRYVAPSQAYMVNGFATSRGEANHQMPSETPGFTLFSFSIGEQITNSIVGIIETGKLSFAYQREGGMGGVPITVDMSETPQKITDWSNCIKTLLVQ